MAAQTVQATNAALSEVERRRWIRLIETLPPPVRRSLERLILEVSETAPSAASPENPAD